MRWRSIKQIVNGRTTSRTVYKERVVPSCDRYPVRSGQATARLIVDHIPSTTSNNRRPGHKLVATTFTIHNTGNPTSSAANERSWLTNPSNKTTASYHIVVDEHESIQCLTLNESSWATGDGINGSGNRTSIRIELCESGDYTNILNRAVSLVAEMLKERGWGVDRLHWHYDWRRLRRTCTVKSAPGSCDM
ncbi:N-acetylmuramoyl-L-alanine amidase [Paenibacillus sp. PL2-23]|uniref:peptidoglycan recognition protein family protein n=1 Tax=Paenibacillus sp. PL2-23 TaxID=2100729 RepID=UPI0030FBE96F